jgi:lipoprotein-releasing system ATP-binding protein
VVNDVLKSDAITLQLIDIYKSYNIGLPSQTEVLHGLDLTLKRGEFVALIGPSGSGKSTLLNLIGLLDKPTAGELLITGQPTTQLQDKNLTQLRAKAIGFVFQFHNLLPEFTATENVMLPLLAAKGYPNKAMRERAEILIEQVGLTEVGDYMSNFIWRPTAARRYRSRLGHGACAWLSAAIVLLNWWMAGLI